jgi:secreted trypsin-like serine protease
MEKMNLFCFGKNCGNRNSQSVFALLTAVSQFIERVKQKLGNKHPQVSAPGM